MYCNLQGFPFTGCSISKFLTLALTSSKLINFAVPFPFSSPVILRFTNPLISFASLKFMLTNDTIPELKNCIISVVPKVPDPLILNGSLVAELSTPIVYVGTPAPNDIAASPEPD